MGESVGHPRIGGMTRHKAGRKRIADATTAGAAFACYRHSSLKAGEDEGLAGDVGRQTAVQRQAAEVRSAGVESPSPARPLVLKEVERVVDADESTFQATLQMNADGSGPAGCGVVQGICPPDH